MQSTREFFIQTLGIEAWLAMVLVILLLALVVSQVARVLFNQLERFTARSRATWDGSLVAAARGPVRLVIAVVALSWIARVLHAQWPEPDFSEEVLQIRNVVIVLTMAWFVWKFIVLLTDRTIQRGREAEQDFDLTTIYAMSKLGRLLVVVVGAIMAANTLGFNVGALLALGGVGGIAIGLAARDLLANFFGGLTIYLDRPFSVGDWIRSPDKSIEGTVEYISWRHTRVRAFNKNPIYVPNAVFTTIVVENPSRMSHRRIKETLGVRYDDFAQIEAIVNDIRTLLSEHPEIDATQTLIVNFSAFAASSLDIMIYAFTHTTNWVKYHEVKQNVLIAIGRVVERHGAEIAFPTRTLHLSQPLAGQPQEAVEDA